VFTIFDDVERWCAPRFGRMLSEPPQQPPATQMDGHASL
jgi:hypothetical protein